MGNWTMVVHGVGPHHNKDYDKDANRLFLEFVTLLRRSGHTVEDARITHGGQDRFQEENPAASEHEQIR